MSDTTTLLGKTNLPVTYLDGTTGTAAVRDLPIGDLPAYWQVIEDEAKTIELFCGEEPGFAARLTRESWEAIIEEGERRNLDFLLRFSRRTQARREKVMPGLQSQLVEALARSLQASPPESEKR